MGDAFKKANVSSIFSPSFPFMLLFNDEQNKVMSLAKRIILTLLILSCC